MGGSEVVLSRLPVGARDPSAGKWRHCHSTLTVHKTLLSSRAAISGAHPSFFLSCPAHRARSRPSCPSLRSVHLLMLANFLEP
jgi:hypothetical protein